MECGAEVQKGQRTVAAHLAALLWGPHGSEVADERNPTAFRKKKNSQKSELPLQFGSLTDHGSQVGKQKSLTLVFLTCVYPQTLPRSPSALTVRVRRGIVGLPRNR